MIDRETWAILADRCAAIRDAREQAEAEDDVWLEFDEHDQARVVRTRPPDQLPS